MSLFQYAERVGFPILYTWISNTIALFALLLLTNALYLCKSKKMHLLIAAAITALSQTIPTFIAYYICFPEPLSVLMTSLLHFMSPLHVLILYPLLRFFAQIPPTRCAVVSKKSIGYSNIMFCVFLAMQEVFIKYAGGLGVVLADFLANCIALIVTLCLALIAYAYVVNNKVGITLSEPFYEKKHYLLNAVVEITIIYIYLVLFRLLFVSSINATHYDTTNYAFHYLSYIVLIVMWVGYFMLGIYRVMLQSKRNEVNNLLSHIAALNEANEQFRGVKHDLNNMIQTYGALIELHDLDKLDKYHQTVYKTTSSATAKLDLSKKLSHYAPLYSLLLEKEGMAATLGVDMNITSAQIDSGLQITDVDMCRIMGVLLDNALEAAVQSVSKKVIVSIEPTRKSVTYIISNSCDEIINIKQIFVKDYSTKGAGRGIGLYETEKIISKNKFISINVKQFDDMVTFYFNVLYSIN